MTDATIALKVDVDTYVGTRDGVPQLLAILERFGIKATFYFSLGPDNSGKAIRRIFTR
jgi:undecaprenyl phosphate-alpha-L-ara4FN deformylase